MACRPHRQLRPVALHTFKKIPNFTTTLLMVLLGQILIWQRILAILCVDWSKHLKPRASRAQMPFKLREDMPGKAVAVHKGGLGFATAAVLAGVPQIILCKHQENWLVANSIVTAGAGVAARYKDVSASTLSETIDRVAASPAMRERALQLAEENAEFRNANPTRAAAEIAAKILSGYEFLQFL